MEVLQKNTDWGVTLKERNLQYQGLSLRYRLNVVCDNYSTRYKVEVRLDDREWACAMVGEDIETALSCFHAVCCGAVTPCTLSEVIGEMQIGN